MYKALYMLVECYAKQRAADNAYDYIYELDDGATEETDNGATSGMRRARPGYVGTYVTPVLEPEGVQEGAEAAQQYNPNDVIRVEVHEGVRARGPVASPTHVVESYYVDEVEDTVDANDGTRAQGSSAGRSEAAQLYNPNDVVRADIQEGARARSRVRGTRREVQSTDDAAEEIESIYMN